LHYLSLILKYKKSPMGRMYLWRLYRFKSGRVVILTSGRFAGKKAIVAKNYEDGTKVNSTLISET